MIVRARLRTDFGRPAQVLHLLDQVLQIQLVVPARAQKLCLALGPDVEILLVQLLRRGLDPRGHHRLPTRYAIRTHGDHSTVC